MYVSLHHPSTQRLGHLPARAGAMSIKHRRIARPQTKEERTNARPPPSTISPELSSFSPLPSRATTASLLSSPPSNRHHIARAVAPASPPSTHTTAIIPPSAPGQGRDMQVCRDAVERGTSAPSACLRAWLPACILQTRGAGVRGWDGVGRNRPSCGCVHFPKGISTSRRMEAESSVWMLLPD